MLACLILNLGSLSCERPVNLSWVNVDSLLELVAVDKETPKDRYLMASDLENKIHGNVVRNKKSFYCSQENLYLNV